METCLGVAMCSGVSMCFGEIGGRIKYSLWARCLPLFFGEAGNGGFQGLRVNF
jgi:hypothetical protein